VQPSSQKPLQVTVFIENEEPFTADMDALPQFDATFVYVRNPRTREGRPVDWMSPGAVGCMIPMRRVLFVEVGVSQSDLRDVEGWWRSTSSLKVEQ
jgi:hypothetical protein